MDEILASIRRIIADEDGAGETTPSGSDAVSQPVRPAEAPRSQPVSPPERWQDRPIATARPVQPAQEARTAPVPPVRGPRAVEPPVPVVPRAASPDAPRPKSLLAPETDAAVAGAFDQLGALLVPAQQRSVEDLMKEMLRPMLKTWLDENLPRVVEGLVRQEIERITRRGR